MYYSVIKASIDKLTSFEKTLYTSTQFALGKINGKNYWKILNRSFYSHFFPNFNSFFLKVKLKSGQINTIPHGIVRTFPQILIQFSEKKKKNSKNK